MATRGKASRLLADATTVVASTVLICIGCALVPAGLGALVLLAASVVTVLLALGCGEVRVVRMLVRAREPSADELAALKPAITLVGRLTPPSPALEVLVRRDQLGVWVGAIGRRTVLVSHGYCAAVVSGALPTEAAAALLAHAVGRVRLGQTRYDVALEFWGLPWRALRGFGRGVGRATRRLPLAALAWRLRLVVAAVALAQSVSEGRPAPGVLAATVVAWSYALPWWERRAEEAAEGAADQFVVDVGLGPALAAFLRRGPQTARLRGRAQRVDHARHRPPGLQLVS